MYCDRCKKRVNTYTVIAEFGYCDKCIGAVMALVSKLLKFYNDHPTQTHKQFNLMCQKLPHKIRESFT